MTIDGKLALAGGRPTGFDYLRLVLAAAVIFVHGVDVTQGQAAGNALMQNSWRAIIMPIVPMFFALSGFLVAGSLYRCRSLVSFLGLRVLRLFPALACEVALSAFILGPIFTTVALSEYFTSPVFYNYFFNMVGLIQYILPGVFTGNPWAQTVNAQLWTVPYELECYISIAVLAVIGITRRRAWLAGFVLLLQAGFIICLVFGIPQINFGRLSVLCFLAGIVFYCYSDKIPMHAGLFALSAASVLGLMLFPGMEYLAALPAVYATVYLGTLNPRKPRFIFGGDYSYGIYLYGFPIQQALVVLVPGLAWYENATAGVLVSLGFAYLSWWWIEKPALGLKPALLRLEARALAGATGEPSLGKLNREPV